MSLILCGCRGSTWHLAGDDDCPERPSRLLRGVGIALLISLPIDAAIVLAALKLAGVL